MDPQAAMMNDAGGGGGGANFQFAATAPFSFSEIWPFMINAATPYGLGLATNVSVLTRDHHCSSMSDPMFLGQRLNQNGRCFNIEERSCRRCRSNGSAPDIAGQDKANHSATG